MKKNIIFLASLLSLSYVQATDTFPYDSLDRNEDKKISVEEASVSEALTKSFADIDLNKDGFLDQSERANLPEVKKQ